MDIIKEEKITLEEVFPPAPFSFPKEPLSQDGMEGWLKREAARAETLKNNNTEQNTRLREKYARATFGLVLGWIGVVTLIVLLDGFSKVDGFNLTQAEMITLLSTTTADIAGFLTIIFLYLFKKES